MTLHEKIKAIIKSCTSEDGWIDMEQVGRQVVWLINSTEHKDE